MVLKKTDCLESGAVSDLLGGLVRLLGQEDSLDVGQDSTLGDGDSGKQFVQLLVVPDGQLEMTGDDPGLLVVTGSVAGQLEDLSSEVLHDGSQVDRCSSTDSFGVVSLAEESVDTTDGELETRSGRSRFGLGSSFASFATARHVCLVWLNERLDLVFTKFVKLVQKCEKP